MSQSGTFANTVESLVGDSISGPQRKPLNFRSGAIFGRSLDRAPLLGVGPRPHLPVPSSAGSFQGRLPEEKRGAPGLRAPARQQRSRTKLGALDREAQRAEKLRPPMTVLAAQTRELSGASLYARGGGQGRKRKRPRGPLGNVVRDSFQGLSVSILCLSRHHLGCFEKQWGLGPSFRDSGVMLWVVLASGFF